MKRIILNQCWLAPMAGFTDCAFREICLRAGAGLVTTEMVSTKGLVYDSSSTKDLLFTNGHNDHTAVQLFGSEPEFFAKAVQMPEIQVFPIIDINMGCPVPKVVKTGAGSALLQNFKLASEIIESTVLASKKIVTVKFRLGWDSQNIVASDFAKMCEDSGASAVCVHGRTRAQLYAGKADWEQIEKVVNRVKIPVIGNGDITDAQTAQERIKNNGVSAVAVGRGALGNPWIFSDFSGNEFNQNRLEVIKENYLLMAKYMPAERVVPAMRAQMNFYIKKLNLGASVRNQLNRENNLERVLEMLADVIKN